MRIGTIRAFFLFCFFLFYVLIAPKPAEAANIACVGTGCLAQCVGTGSCTISNGGRNCNGNNCRARCTTSDCRWQCTGSGALSAANCNQHFDSTSTSNAGPYCSGNYVLTQWGSCYTGGSSCGVASGFRARGFFCEILPCSCVANPAVLVEACGGSCTSSTPVAPTSVTVIEGDANGGAIVQTRRIKIDWLFASNNSGCGQAWGHNCAGNNNQFIVRITGPAGFSNVSYNVGSTLRTLTTGNILNVNGAYTVQVCSNNGALETCASANFTKVAYPSGTLTGPLQERTPNSSPIACNTGVRASYVNSISLTGSNPGAVTSCTLSPATGIATSYTCTVALDNLANDPNPNASYTLQLGSASALYGSVSCGGASCATPGSCTNTFTPDLDANGGTTSSVNQTLYMNVEGTLAGSTNYSFYKVKNVSYYDRDSVVSVFPVGHQSYDTDDTPNSDFFNRGDDATTYNGVGVVMSNGAQLLGAQGAANNGTSPRGWASSTYTTSASTSLGTNFIDYLKNSRAYTTITSISQITGATGVYIANGNLTISAADATTLANKSIVIAATGNITINASLSSATSNLALVAQNIYISEAVTDLRGLFVANAVSLVSQGFAGTGTNPLKVIGVISSGSTVDVTKRARSDSFKPSIFIVANPDIYSILLSDITVAKYDWKQLQ